MKKIILATVSAFAISVLGSASAVYACDGMKGHAKGDKADQSDSQANTAAKKDTKAGTKADQKS